jgi:hypothetical protein
MRGWRRRGIPQGEKGRRQEPLIAAGAVSRIGQIEVIFLSRAVVTPKLPTDRKQACD